jgi:hypothetical protein
MLEESALERDELALQEIDSPQSIPAFGREPNAQPLRPAVKARAPLRREGPAAERPELPTRPREGHLATTGKKPGKGVLKRRAVVCAIGAMVLAPALAGGDLYPTPSIAIGVLLVSGMTATVRIPLRLRPGLSNLDAPVNAELLNAFCTSIQIVFFIFALS